MYNYINKRQIYNLANNGRIGFIVRDIRTNDIEEYVNNCIITLGNDGFDSKIIKQPKIFINETDGNSKNLVFMLNKSFDDMHMYPETLDYFNNNLNILSNWMNKMGNAFTLENYIIRYLC